MTASVTPRIVVVISFVALTIGFFAGAWLERSSRETQTRTAAAPHDVGLAEYVELGMRALNAGDPFAAERHFRAALDLGPSTPDVRANLAVALMAQGRWEEADRELAEAKRLGPDRPEFLFIEGVLARDGLGDLDRARAAWTRFIDEAPPDAPQVQVVEEWLATLDSEGAPAN